MADMRLRLARFLLHLLPTKTQREIVALMAEERGYPYEVVAAVMQPR